MTNNVKVRFNGKEYFVPRGTLLSHIDGVEKPCGGHGRCGKCKVKASGALSAISETERGFLSDDEIKSGIRLACMTLAEGDCRVYSSEATANDRIVSDGDMPEINIDPVFYQYGMAIDIGTTTLAAVLYDQNGNICASETALNPQARFGADVVSRIEAHLNGNGETLASVVREAIDRMVLSVSRKSEIDAEKIDKAVITGNTAMIYLATNTSPESISHAPFEADRLFGECLTARNMGLKSLSPDTEIYLPPCISAFVGADMTCAVLASAITRNEKSAFIADIGTNGEMALWHNGTLNVCSTAAGPAFEGVGITMGMRASDGAVDKAVLCNGKPLISHIGDKTPCGICGSGLVDIIACLLDTEEIDETGYLETDPYMLTDTVMLTAGDVRMVQLAKSAVCAGIMTLMHNADVTENDISDFCIAGGFGKYLNLKNAVKIGLLPHIPGERIRLLGNAALSGASMLLLSKDLKTECEGIARSAVLTELSTNPYFAEEYMMGMMFHE